MQVLNVFLYILLAITSLFLVCLVLIQRGKGGGLAGAFGGQGGSSAFGSKAGDVFTRVTMIAAGFWIGLNMLLVVISNNRASAWATEPGATKKAAGTGSGTGSTDGANATRGVGIPDALDGKAGSSATNPIAIPPAGGPAAPLGPLTAPAGSEPGTPGLPSAPGFPLQGPKP